MGKIKQLFLNIIEDLKKESLEFWQQFVTAVSKNQRKTIAFALVGVLLSCGLSFLMVSSQTRIRSSLVDRMAFYSLPPEKIQPLHYKQAEQQIKEKKAVSIMFSKPNGKQLNEVFKIVDERHSELNRNFYYYPIVYDSENFKEQYQVDPTQITFVFYENGQEKNRFTMSELNNPQSDFIPELNRLPMWNMKETNVKADEKNG